jgi:hypothetical protein
MISSQLPTLACAVLLALPTAAADRSASQHQVVHCMLARMKANRSEPYREALKTCKDQLTAAARNAEPNTALNSQSTADSKH